METSDKVTIEWVVRSGEECLKFSFGSVLTKQTATEAITKWKKHFCEREGCETILIWDCSTLTDYEPMARILWQKALKEMGGQINVVYLISQSTLIRTGAALMSLFTKFKLKSISSEKEIKLSDMTYFL